MKTLQSRASVKGDIGLALLVVSVILIVNGALDVAERS